MTRKNKYINAILNRLIWDQAPKIDKNTVDNSFEKLLNIFELCLDTHAPLKRHSNAELKFIFKPRLINGIKTSIRTIKTVYVKEPKATRLDETTTAPLPHIINLFELTL